MKIRNQVTFAIVPEWLLYSSVSAQAIRLYGVLNRHADKIGRARPSRRRMADLMHVSRKTIDRSLDELESIGAVTIKPNYSQRGDQTTNGYVVNVVPKGATQMSMGGDRDVATPLDTDVAQNESHSELDIPLPPQSGGSKRSQGDNPRAKGTNPRAQAAKRERERLETRMAECDVCGDRSNFICGNCLVIVRRLSELKVS